MVPHAGVLPLQTWHEVPMPPQALSDVPAPFVHVWALVQHPPVHAPQLCVPPQPSEMIPHELPQATFVQPQMPGVPPPPHVAGAVQLGALPVPVQPHAPLMHAVPAGELVQTEHAPPAVPHVAGRVSAVWQLVPSQHAPLHASPPEQVVAHVFDDWHALPAGQSPAEPHPHTPPS